MTNATQEMKRSVNAMNRWQGEWPRVLCVCSAGLLRSPTLAWVLSNPPYNCNTRSAGSYPEYALVYAEGVLIHWAERIVFASRKNCDMLQEYIPNGKIFYVLDIPDIPDKFPFRHPALVTLIHKELQRVHFPIHTPEENGDV